MLPQVLESRYVTRHVIWLRFNDGVEGDIDLSSELYGGVFEPFRNIEYFKKFEVHPEFRTLVWPNGADFAP